MIVQGARPGVPAQPLPQARRRGARVSFIAASFAAHRRQGGGVGADPAGCCVQSGPGREFSLLPLPQEGMNNACVCTPYYQHQTWSISALWLTEYVVRGGARGRRCLFYWRAPGRTPTNSVNAGQQRRLPVARPAGPVQPEYASRLPRGGIWCQ